MNTMHGLLEPKLQEQLTRFPLVGSSQMSASASSQKGSNIKIQRAAPDVPDDRYELLLAADLERWKDGNSQPQRDEID